MAADGDGHQLASKTVHQALDALAFHTVQAARRKSDVAEENLGRVLGMVADLLEAAATLHPRGGSVHDEQREGITAIDRGCDDEQVRQLTVRDEDLLTRQTPAVTVPAGGTADGVQVAARARLRHRDAGDGLAAEQARKPFTLLRIGLEVHDIGHGHLGMDAEARPRRVCLRKFLQHDGTVKIVGARAAPGLIHRAAQQAHRIGLAPRLARLLARMFPVAVIWCDLLRDEVTYLVAELSVLRREERSGQCYVLIHVSLLGLDAREQLLGFRSREVDADQ